MMKYKYNYQVTASDIWKLSISNIYNSMIGVCNIIFTFAILLLTIKFWANATTIIKILLVLAVSLFTIIQPIAIYIQAKRLVTNIPSDLEIGFDDYGVHIMTKHQNSKFEWDKIKGVYKKPNMLIIYTAHKQGYVLTNKVLGMQKEDLYDYIFSKINMGQH